MSPSQANALLERAYKRRKQMWRHKNKRGVCSEKVYDEEYLLVPALLRAMHDAATKKENVALADRALRIMALVSRFRVDAKAYTRRLSPDAASRWRENLAKRTEPLTSAACELFLSQAGMYCRMASASSRRSIEETREDYVATANGVPATTCDLCASVAALTHAASWMAVERRSPLLFRAVGYDTCLWSWKQNAEALCIEVRRQQQPGAPLSDPILSAQTQDGTEGLGVGAHELHASAFRRLRCEAQRTLQAESGATCTCGTRDARTGGQERKLLCACLARVGEIVSAIRMVQAADTTLSTAFHHVDDRSLYIPKQQCQVLQVVASRLQECPRREALARDAQRSLGELRNIFNSAFHVANASARVLLPGSHLLYACAALRTEMCKGETASTPTSDPMLLWHCGEVLLTASAAHAQVEARQARRRDAEAVPPLVDGRLSCTTPSTSKPDTETDTDVAGKSCHAARAPRLGKRASRTWAVVGEWATSAAAAGENVFACAPGELIGLIVEAMLICFEAEHAPEWCGFAHMLLRGPLAAQSESRGEAERGGASSYRTAEGQSRKRARVSP